MTAVWISALGLLGATIIGSLLGFFFKELPHKWNDIILGYCAGVMLSAAVFGLIAPAFEVTSALTILLVAGSVMVGAMFLNIMDLVTPHLHHITGLDSEEHMNNSSLNHVLLFVLAIALHKLPEGIAAGVSLNEPSDNEWIVSLGIAIQNVPEGMIIIAPLLISGVSKTRTLIISLAIGLLEIIGVLIGFTLGAISELLLPVFLGFAGGAMLYVVSDEMIPETHAHGFQKQATYALLLGTITMIIFEKIF